MTILLRSQMPAFLVRFCTRGFQSLNSAATDVCPSSGGRIWDHHRSLLPLNRLATGLVVLPENCGRARMLTRADV